MEKQIVYRNISKFNIAVYADIKTLLCIIFFLISISSCSKEDIAQIHIFQGRQKYNQAKFDESLTSYLNINQNNKYIDYANLGIGTIYLIKNESEYAISKLTPLETSKNNNIKLNALYQHGIIEFRNGRYKEAKLLFKKCIQYDPTAIDAKINYELCSKILKSRGQSQRPSFKGIAEEKENNIREKTVFDLIRKKEEEKWENTPQQKIEKPINDY